MRTQPWPFDSTRSVGQFAKKKDKTKRDKKLLKLWGKFSQFEDF